MRATTATNSDCDHGARQNDIALELQFTRYRIQCRITKATRFHQNDINWNPRADGRVLLPKGEAGNGESSEATLCRPNPRIELPVGKKRHLADKEAENEELRC